MVSLDILHPAAKFKFGPKMREYVSNTILSTILLASIPWILVIAWLGLISGTLRAILGPAPLAQKIAKKEKDEDSGISDAASEAEEEEEPPNFSPKIQFETISDKLKMLKFSENLAENVLEYLGHAHKFPVLVTLRDVALLTSYQSDNVVRVQCKRRKIKVMTIPAENLSEIFGHLENSDGHHPVLIYLFPEVENAEKFPEKLTENRKFVMEIKEIIGGEKKLEDSEYELLVIKKEEIVWVNSGF